MEPGWLRQLAFILFFSVIIGGFLISTVELLGASWYDIRLVRKRIARRRAPGTRLTVIVLVSGHLHDHGHERLQKCLLSLAHARPKPSVVIVSSAAGSKTIQLLRRLAVRHKNWRLIVKRRPTSVAFCLKSAARTLKTNDWAWVLDGHDLVEEHSLNALRSFAAQTGANAILANIQLESSGSLIGLGRQLRRLIDNGGDRLSSLLNSHLALPMLGSAFKVGQLKTLLAPRRALDNDYDRGLYLTLPRVDTGRLIYASSVRLRRPGQADLTERARVRLELWQTLWRLRSHLFSANGLDRAAISAWQLPLTWWRQLLFITQPLLVSYFVYLAIVYKLTSLLLLTWAGVTGIIVFLALSEQGRPITQKMNIIIHAPVGLALATLDNLLELVAVGSLGMGLALRRLLKWSRSPAFQIARKTAPPRLRPLLRWQGRLRRTTPSRT